MKTLKPSYFLVMALFVVTFAASVLFQQKNIEHWRQLPFRYRNSLYLPSSQYVKTVSVGYDQFAADFLWLRMIQSFAGAWSSPDNASLMKSYFEIITDLDRKFLDVYSFALMAISDEGRHTASLSKDHPEQKIKAADQMAISIIEKAIRELPGNYQISFEGAFYAFWSLNDANLAKYYVRMAKMDPQYPKFIDRWEGFFEIKQGRYQAAYEKYLTDYLHTIQGRNKELYSIMNDLLTHAVNDWFKYEVKQRAIQWHEQHGRYPSIVELEDAHRFAGVMLPDWKKIQAILQGLISGSINAKFDEAAVTKVVRGALHPWSTLPPGPYDNDKFPALKGYAIWKDKKPEDADFVMSKAEMVADMINVARQAKAQANNYKKKHKFYPKDLTSFLPLYEKIDDPFGGKWIYNTEKGELNTTIFPQLFKVKLPEIR